MSHALTVREDNPKRETATHLMRQLLEEEAVIYADMGPDPFDSFQPDDSLSPRSVFLIARQNNVPVGCGVLRPLDAGSAEINRMFVVPTSRRRGVGRAILEHLEQRALEFGYGLAGLETGKRERAALSLYESGGFKRSVPFGSHADDPVSVFFEKALGKA